MWWRFSGFYGELRREKRKESWYLARFLGAQYDIPWLCAGDFNEVLHTDEQFGGNQQEEWMMELGFSGGSGLLWPSIYRLRRPPLYVG
jgi:hypothetical protein